MIKKILSIISLFIILTNNIVLIYNAKAAGSIDITLYELRNSSGNSVNYFNPGDGFALNIQATNNTGIDVKNLFANLSFGDNSKFSYLGSNLKSVINFQTTNNPIPVGAYNYTSGFLYELTNSTYPILANTKKVFLQHLITTGTGFKIDSSISTYQNTLSSYFNGLSNTDSSSITGLTSYKTFYVNVRPHITDYSFSKSSLVGNGTDNLDLTVKVKDYNGCSNIDGGIITANLSSLGLSNSETLNYISCDTDGKTAIFKKMGITTLSTAGDKTLSYNDFTAKDEDNNINTPIDANTNFDDEDKKSNLILTITTPNAPIVNISSINPISVSTQSSTLNFSSTQTGSYKSVINGDGTCSAGTIISDWQNYDGSSINLNIDAANLIVGANTIYVCVKNTTGDIGASNINLTKDLTAPSFSNISSLPASVTTANSTVSFACSEDGQYKTITNGNDSGYQSTTAGTINNVIVNNGYFNLGANTVNLYCKDIAGNEGISSTIITKIQPTPAMSSSGLTLSDGDIDWDGVTGRDLKVTWDNTIAKSFAGFESYKIYILPENTSFSNTYTSVGTMADSGATTWTGNVLITNDSAGNPLAGGNYVTYVSILGTSGELGTPASATGTLVSDIVPHPSALSASFTSTGKLSVKFDAGLRTDLTNYTATGYVYTINGITYTGTSIESVVNDTVNINIPDIGNTFNTGVLSVYTGAAWGLPVDGSYNNVSTGIIISDNIKPNISNFSTGTTSYYQNYYSGIISLNYNISENLLAGGNTKIDFTRVGGNNDITKTFHITNQNDLTSGNHTINIDMASLGLIAGAYYDISFTAIDLVGNAKTSNIISIKFDNIGPEIVSINPFGPQKVLGILNPIFTWFSSSDNSGNGSGIKGYKLKVYTGNNTYTSWHSCTGAYSEYNITNLSDLSKQVNLSNLYNYAWAVTAYDNMENIGISSNCDNFYINNLVPSFSNSSITDTSINNTSYAKSGDNLVIKSTITNSNSSNIWLNASSLKDSSYSNINCSSPVSGVTCSYSSNIATYTFLAGAGLSSGVKQVQFTATNTSGINTGTTLSSITIDNTNPVSPSISSPNTGTYGGNSLNIAFAGASDNIGINYLKFEYSSNGGTNWNLIGTGSNSLSYNWNITSITSGTNYKVKITTYDMVGNNSSIVSNTFSIDKIAPTVPTTSITSPSNSGIKLKGGANVAITWNSAGITDNIGLATNPITLYYSTDGGTNYNQIATNEANDGNYNWLIPSLNNTTLKIKLEVSDNVGNKAFDISDNNFEIDSTNPIINVTYAGLGGNTPQNNKYINNSGIDITSTISDSNLSGGNATYSFYNQTTNTYWNGTSYVGTEVYNSLSSINSNNYNLLSSINPIILNGNTYKLKLKATDIVGNSYTTPQITYIGDTLSPNISFANNSTVYSSGNILLSGTSSDAASGLGSVKLEIKNGTDYFDGANFSNSAIQLITNSSNSYSNWNYNFNIPGTINDGTSMEIKAFSYDKAYKTPNIGSGKITVIKDISGPNINSGVILFPTSTGSFRGGQTIDIKWDSSKITDSISGLKTNSIELEYLDGAGNYQTIASGLANNGTYTWTIPTYDRTNSKIRIKATDNVGLYTYQLSNSFLVDSLPPEITSLETLDRDTNGKIDSVLVKFSESIKDNSINLSKFSLSDGINITGFETAESVDDDNIILSFTNTGNTSYTPTLTYSNGGVQDYVGNNLLAGNKLAIDKVVARLENASIFDTNSNGKLDKIEITLSENINTTSVNNGFNIVNAYAGMSIASVNTSLNKINLILNESTDFNTSSTNLLLNLNNSVYSDLAGNLIGNISSHSIDDKASPILLNAITADLNNNFKVDKVNLSFSENIENVSLADLSLSYISTGASISNISGTGSDTLSLNINETSNDNDTNYKPNLSYSGVSIKDLANNKTSNFTYSVKDGISPKIISRETLDSNNNGKADSLKINFSENINQNISSILVSINGYNSLSYSAGTNYLIVNINEKDLIDTSTTLDSKIISNSSLKDNENNLVLIDSNYSSSIDKMGPIISFAKFDGTNKIYLDFSENITNNSLINSNFVLSGTTANISSINYTSNSNNAVLNIDSSNMQYGVSSISFTTNIVNDSNGNSKNTTIFTRISPSIIINEIMHANSKSNQYIELKNNGNTSVSLSGWIIQNASASGTTNIVLNAGATIGANSYYLITNANTSTSILSGSISPDYINSNLSLNPTSQNNLVLTNKDGIVYDSALASPWASGNSSLNYSMERKEVPGNGSIGTNWYTAVASIGFDSSDYKGTPKTENKIDINAPVISSYTPSENTLFPVGNNISLNFNYSDDISGIATGTTNLIIEKYNGTGFDQLSSVINSSNISNSSSNYSLANLAFGKYRAIFQISDKSNNTVNQIVNFYVDKVEFVVSTGSINVGNLKANIGKYAQIEETVTVKTLGAGFRLYNGKNSLLNKGLTDIVDYNGNYGFGFDLYKNENGTIKDYDSTINQVNNTIIGNVSKNISNSNGTQRTYTYKLKYYVKVEDIQEAGNYSTNTHFDLIMDY